MESNTLKLKKPHILENQNLVRKQNPSIVVVGKNCWNVSFKGLNSNMAPINRQILGWSLYYWIIS